MLYSSHASKDLLDEQAILIAWPMKSDRPKEGDMPLPTEEIFDKALAMSKNVEDNFLDLGRQLRQLLDRDPEKFQEIIAKSDLGRRKAYYLVEVSKTFDPLPISRARLKKLGWTKLQIIGKHVTKENVEELVKLAEEMNGKALERHMKTGETPIKNARWVLLFFSPEQYAELEEALLANGAKKNPKGSRGLEGKEDALVTIIRKAGPAAVKATKKPPEASD
jgi:hypothetical protein